MRCTLYYNGPRGALCGHRNDGSKTGPRMVLETGVAGLTVRDGIEPPTRGFSVRAGGSDSSVPNDTKSHKDTEVDPLR